MTNKIIAVQGNHPSKLNPKSDTSVFLANEIQSKYKIFYYDAKDLSIINSKVIAKGFFIKFDYNQKKLFKIIKNLKLNLELCKYILIRQDPPFNLEYISTTYILDQIKHKVKIINDPTSIRNVSEKLYSAKYQKFMPDTIFSQNLDEIKSFFKKNKKVIVKPIHSYSGNDILLMNSFNLKTINNFIKKAVAAFVSVIQYVYPLLVFSPKRFGDFLLKNSGSGISLVNISENYVVIIVQGSL